MSGTIEIGLQGLKYPIGSKKTEEKGSPAPSASPKCNYIYVKEKK